jgi:release factor glutamine methyltransferase
VSRSLAALVADASRALRSAGLSDEESRNDGALLARHVLGWDAARWLTHSQDAAPADFSRAFESLISRRARREPLAYITGEREFYGRTFRVTPDVLIPRPETELIVDEVRAVVGPEQTHARASRLVDLGTGSGCLGVTLALELPLECVIATDASAAAVAVARANARALGAGDRVEFQVTSWSDGLDFDGPVHVIVANPPYVPERDRANLAPEVRDYEPADAVFSGADGLEAIRAIVPAVARALAPGGWLIMEIGQHQDREVAEIIASTPGLSLLRIAPDLQSIPRVVVAHVPVLSNHRW